MMIWSTAVAAFFFATGVQLESNSSFKSQVSPLSLTNMRSEIEYILVYPKAILNSIAIAITIVIDMGIGQIYIVKPHTP